MTLKEDFEKSGNWLFRWRSYLPLLMVGILLPSLRSFVFFDGGRMVDELWEVFCLAVSLFGLGIRAWTVGYVPAGTSGRNTRRQVATELNTSGAYSLVRHPLYLGNFFAWLGVSLFIHVWWLTLIFVLVFWLYYERIMFAEEAFLEEQFGADYLAWAARTPAFVPRPSQWEPPVRPFSCAARCGGNTRACSPSWPRLWPSISSAISPSSERSTSIGCGSACFSLRPCCT